MSLNPMDDALFQKMAENKDFCQESQEILQVILNNKKLVVLSTNSQFATKNLQGRSCMLDAKCQLEDGRIVNIEVQRADDDDHQRRVRYNGTLLTTNLTNPSTKFAEIPDVMNVFNTYTAYDDEKFPVTSAYKRRYKTTEKCVRLLYATKLKDVPKVVL